MSTIHIISFPEDGTLDGASARLEIIGHLLDHLAASSGEPLVALPAGWLRARSTRERDQWADEARRASNQSGVSMVFGVDVDDVPPWGIHEPPRSYVYACSQGRWMFHPAAASDGLMFDPRSATIAGLRLIALLGREIFSPAAAAAVSLERPDVVLVLAHGGPTPKWVKPLSALARLAPTLLVRQQLPLRGPGWNQSPAGWTASRREMAERLSVVSYRLAGSGRAAQSEQSQASKRKAARSGSIRPDSAAGLARARPDR